MVMKMGEEIAWKSEEIVWKSGDAEKRTVIVISNQTQFRCNPAIPVHSPMKSEIVPQNHR